MPVPLARVACVECAHSDSLLSEVQSISHGRDLGSRGRSIAVTLLSLAWDCSGMLLGKLSMGGGVAVRGFAWCVAIFDYLAARTSVIQEYSHHV